MSIECKKVICYTDLDCFQIVHMMFFQRETDGVKIKTKMLEDQTETIRKLKEVSFL